MTRTQFLFDVELASRCQVPQTLVMIDFRDLRPSWQIESSFKDRDDLRKLGCSEQLIAWLNPNPDVWMLMVEPEDWFWRDRNWYGDANEPTIAELHRISGGTFCAMPLRDQCDFLGIPLITITGQKAKGHRGKWIGNECPLCVEDFALEHMKSEGFEGYAFEGKGYAAWMYVQQDFYRAIFKRIPGFDRVNGKLAKTIPSSASATDYLTALRTARAKIDGAYALRKAYYDKLWPPITLSSLAGFTELIGWEMIESMHDLNFRLGANVSRGWPDLTIKKESSLQFVEIKSGDKLHGSQADWVRNVARPLGLEVSVLQVVEG